MRVGIDRVITPNGHTLDYTDNGIFHSAGKSVAFERNSAGRRKSGTGTN